MHINVGNRYASFCVFVDLDSTLLHFVWIDLYPSLYPISIVSCAPAVGGDVQCVFSNARKALLHSVHARCLYQDLF